MCRIINKDELKSQPSLLRELKSSVFIYPTDTIYGMGCDATNDELVAKIRTIKKCSEKPFSVIVPNKSLIFSYCKADAKAKKWVDKIPGPYTLILKLKKRFFSNNVNPLDNTVGIRIPNHWIYNVVKKLKVPIVTTSANVTGDDFMTSLDDLNPELKKKVDFIIYDGVLRGRPSTIVHLERDDVEVKHRG